MKKIVTVVLAALLAATLLACTGCGNTQSVENIQKNGELIVYTNAEFAPFEYISGGKPVGVDIDICQKIADELGVTLTVENVDFDIIVSSVQSGKAALGAAGMTVTDERKESVDFSISYTTSTQYVITSEEFEVNNIEDLQFAGLLVIYFCNSNNNADNYAADCGCNCDNQRISKSFKKIQIAIVSDKRLFKHFGKFSKKSAGFCK